MVSFLTARFGIAFLDSANDIAQETLLSAINHWRTQGVPKNPEGWLYIVAKNKAINYLKRQSRNVGIDTLSHTLTEPDSPSISLEKEIEDSMLKMIFACSSPLVPMESQVVLILSSLCGFSRKEIASAMVTNEEVIKKKLYRAKKKIRDANTTLEVPGIDALNDRLNGVSNSLYLLFNEGYNSSSANDLIRKDICLEAVRLAKLLSQYFPEDTRTKALLALMCFHIARFDSRMDQMGAIVLFKDQNRSLWNQQLINQGIVQLSMAAEGDQISSYHLEAGIAMQHCMAKDYDSTNWSIIKSLYTQLYEIKKSPVIKLNLAIVEGILHGPMAAIAILEDLKSKNKRLSQYYLLYATLGEFYKRVGQNVLATKNFKVALDLTENDKEKQLLSKKLEVG